MTKISEILDWLVEDHLDVQGMDKESKFVWDADKKHAEKLLKAHIAEVIGEDLPYVIEHKGKPLHLYPERVDAQNDLRAEQRRRAGI